MAFSCQSVLDLARLDLNDDAKIRLADADLLKYLNDGIALTYVMRPDLRFNSYGTAYTDLTVNSDFPLDIQYRQALANYIISRANTGDDEFVNSGTVALTYKEFLSGLGLPSG